MVHIELCHPNMEVKIKESRVKEEDYYLDLNSANNNSHNSSTSSHQSNLTNTNNNNNYMHANSKTTFEIIPNKCHQEQQQQQQLNNNNNNLRKRKIDTRFEQSDNNPASDSNKSSVITTSVLSYNKPTTTTTTSVSSSSSSASISSSASSICSSPAHSPQPLKNQSTTARSGSSPDMAPVVSESVKTSSSEHETSAPTEPFINIANQSAEDEDNNKDGNNYVTVFNRPKQYFGSLYEPDKQYSCKLCTYTTNHKPSMEDHVYVHTNKRPYRWDFLILFFLFDYS